MKKTYFLSPNFDYPPGGALSLGRILTSPFDPGTCINPDGPLPFHTNMPVQSTSKRDWKSEKERGHNGLLGLWARFLQFFGLDTGARVDWETKKGDVYEFKLLETQFFDPTKDYIEESVLDLPVATHIVDTDYKKRIYMITGVKIARGADVAVERYRELTGHVHGGIDGTAGGVPVSGGAEAKFRVHEKDNVTFHGSSDFVFAYRLREIYYEKGIKLRDKEFIKGALYDLDKPDKSEEEKRLLREEFLRIGRCAEENETADKLGLNGVSALDDEDGERCGCVVPNLSSRN